MQRTVAGADRLKFPPVLTSFYLVLPAKNGLENNFNQKGMGIKGEVVQYSM